MNTTTKIALAALAIAAGAWSAQAQAAYNGDLVVGFTTGASGANDYELDLGRASSLATGFGNTTTFNLGTALSGFNLSGTSWGVIGTLAVSGKGNSWFSIDRGAVPGNIANAATWSSINTAVVSLYTGFATAGAGASATPNNSDANSWNQQTIVGPNPTSYVNTYGNPNIGSALGQPLGPGSMDFYQIIANNTTPTEIGVFTLNSTGTTLTFTAVPEPTTYGLLAGAGLLILSVRRVFRKGA
jgi:hypothetical protein